MSLLVPIALFGWIPAILLVFSVLPPRWAVITGFLGGWLFLPCAGYSVAGLPDYTKMSATCAGIMLATTIFHPNLLTSLRPRWLDLPMVVWCVCPCASSMMNGLGAYDGVSAVLNRTILWGFPYLVGRVHFRDLQSLRMLAIGVFAGGLIYVPLCLYEIRMSPQLHNMVYGFSPAWHNVRRAGGWRPMVFMDDGLMLGMWMTTATLVGVWLWHTGCLRELRSVRAKWLVLMLLVTAILCKSTGAFGLLLMGLIVLYVTRRFATRSALVVLVLLPLAYMTARTVGGWSGSGLLTAASHISEERQGSLQTRLENEDILNAHALQRPLFGWGGWGRNRPADTHTITDGLWVVALGTNGVVGLAGITLVQLLPIIILLWRMPPARWAHPLAAAPAAMAVCLALYGIDNILNAMPNPVFLLMAGALVSTLAALPVAGVARIRLDQMSGIRRLSRRIGPAPGSLPVEGGNLF